MDERGLLNIGDEIIIIVVLIYLLLALQVMSMFILELDARIGHIPLQVMPFI